MTLSAVVPRQENSLFAPEVLAMYHSGWIP